VKLIFALDAGGDDATDFITVAGFASSERDWEEFSKQWKVRLDQDGIEFFHAVDAAGFRGPFRHWHDRPDREQLRRALFVDLMDIIKRNAYQKVACTIVNKDYQSANTELREEFADTAYCVAARTCEKYCRHWVITDWKSCPNTEFAFIFEAGDQGQSKLQERLKKEGGFIPANFLPKKDSRRNDGSVEKKGYIPLQAADWLAWELNRAARDFYPEKLESESRLRWPMQQFLGRPDGKIGIYSPDNLANMDKMIALEKQVGEWATSLGVGTKEQSSGPTKTG
jgi:hypothetical protein